MLTFCIGGGDQVQCLSNWLTRPLNRFFAYGLINYPPPTTLPASMRHSSRDRESFLEHAADLLAAVFIAPVFNE